MGTAIGGIDVIHERKDIFCVAVVMLESHFHQHAVLFAAGVENIVIKRLTAFVDIRNKFLDAAFVVEGAFLFLAFPQVDEVDFQTFCEESCFSQALFQNIIGKHRFFKNFRVRQEMNEGTVFVCGADFVNRAKDIASFVFLFIDFAVGIDVDIEPCGQGVYNGRTYTVQTAGYFISAAAEFTACMQYGEYNLQSRNAFLMVDAYRDTTTVIQYGNGVVGVDGNGDFCTEACQGFVHGIIHDFVYQMVEPLFTGGADIHARAFAHRFQTFQDLDLAFIIFC